jgi:hypothetical protein
MRRFTLASVVLIASVAQAADGARTVVPQARPRLSPEIVATLSGQSAKPVAVPDADVAEGRTPVLTESAATARPRGEIVEMAPYIVAEPKAKAPKEYQMLTPKGRVELALKRRPGLKFLNFWGLNNGIAVAMLQEDLALERRREAAELMSLYLIK